MTDYVTPFEKWGFQRNRIHSPFYGVATKEVKKGELLTWKSYGSIARLIVAPSLFSKLDILFESTDRLLNLGIEQPDGLVTNDRKRRIVFPKKEKKIKICPCGAYTIHFDAP